MKEKSIFLADQSRIQVIVGHYGSGKTEISINQALRLADGGERVTLVDLDIVNPFFRSNEHRAELEAHGVRVLAPNFANTAVDVPSLPAEIQSVFHPDAGRVIFDVGGDDAGARPLGTYADHFARAGYRMYYIINGRRPFSETAKDILAMQRAIEDRSRLQVHGYINNTNLGRETETFHLLEGQRLVDDVSALTGIPVAGIAGMPRVLAGLPAELRDRALPIVRYSRLDWE